MFLVRDDIITECNRLSVSTLRKIGVTPRLLQANSTALHVLP